MKLNLKNVQRMFKHGIKVDNGAPVPVNSITLHALNIRGSRSLQYSNAGTLDRDKFLDLAPRELKRVIHNMRNRATAIDPNRDNWLIETQCCGDYYTRTLRVN